MRKTTIFLVGLLLAGLSGYAQTISGSVSGRVVDSQGAVIPNATVTVTEPAKDVKVTTKTSNGGDFNVPGLLPGSYSITVEATGFKKLSRTGIALDANDYPTISFYEYRGSRGTELGVRMRVVTWNGTF